MTDPAGPACHVADAVPELLDLLDRCERALAELLKDVAGSRPYARVVLADLRAVQQSGRNGTG